MNNNAKALAREMNTILFELCRASVKSAICRDLDQLSAWISLSEYTVAQILEFIRLAQEKNSVNALGVLLEYKQQNFPEFDPMAEFILD